MFRSLLLALGLAGLTVAAVSTLNPAPASRPGALGSGVTLLPNGWKIAPVGRHVPVGDLPLDLVESPDGESLFVANNGYARPTISVVRLSDMSVRDTLPLDHAWLGLGWHPDGRRLFVSGAANNTVHELFFDGRGLRRVQDLVLGRPMERGAEPTEDVVPRTARPDPAPQSFVAGLAIAPDGRTLYATHIFGQLLSVVDLPTGHVRRNIDLPAEPYTTVVSPDGATVYVSLWGGAKVLAYDAATLALKSEITVGEHPNAMVLSRDGARLFVACANTNSVWIVDAKTGQAQEQVSVAIDPQSPPGSTPNSVALSPDGQRLLVANADNNTVAIVDVSTPGKSQVEGLIPTGWYPTAAKFSRDGSQIYILSGKGLVSAANPRLRTGANGGERQYIGATLTGTLTMVATPDKARLAAYTKTVHEISRYSDAVRLAPANAPAASPIPQKVGGVSPIKHVFYVVRENRTYDQVFGDLERGNGDPNLALFGEEITPNAHALAREFGVLDNFYVDAEVSYDGHAFSMGAYATDFVEKIWPTNYASRGAIYLSEGTGTMRNPYGNVSAPANGYIWDAANRANVAVRSYGEFTEWAGTAAEKAAGVYKAKASVPGLAGRISESYPPWDLAIPDNTRVDAWMKEFREFERTGTLPGLSIVRLGNDHTSATRPNTPTPRAMVAENDLALGRFVEAISNSRFWKESIIFVLEDDAQNGPDHIDAHRSPVLVISPFSKRRTVDSTLYTTSGVLRTIELILGLPPMSQYDAAATPFYNALQATPVLTPFTHLEPRVSTREMNGPNAYGSLASLRMDLSSPDRVPDLELTEIIWRSMRGANVTVPPPVRSAFLRYGPALAADEDEAGVRLAH